LLPCPVEEPAELSGEFGPSFSEPAVSSESSGDGVTSVSSDDEPELPGIREMIQRVTSRIQTAAMV